MLKFALIYLVLSIIVVFFAKYVFMLLVYIDFIYSYLNASLVPIFSNTAVGALIRTTLLLIVIPLVVVGIPAGIYRLIKGQNMTYFMQITWLVWLILVLSKILVR